MIGCRLITVNVECFCKVRLKVCIFNCDKSIFGKFACLMAPILTCIFNDLTLLNLC